MRPTVLNLLWRGTILVLVLVAWGCASGPSFQPAQPKSDMALLYLYRTSSMVGAANHEIAAVNGKPVAEMESGSYFMMDLPVGETVITRKAASALFGSSWGLGALVGALDGFVETEQFEAYAGRRYFVRFPSGELEKDEAEALDDLRGLDLLHPYQ
jgi:Protein of unknown function (DUF2846)